MSVAAPRLAIIDLDGTLYRWSLYIELIEQLMRFQRLLPAHFFESQAHRKTWEERSLNDDAYLSHFIHDWEARAIMGLSDGELTLAVHEVLRRQKSRAYIFTRELLAVLKDCHYHLIAIGGSPQSMVQELAKGWKFDEWFGTEYLLDQRRVYVRDQSRTKKMEQEKGEVVRTLLKQGTLRDGSIALGDTVTDWEILKQVEYPIAFNPEQSLHMKARQTGTPVVWERKNVVAAYRTQPEALGARPDAFLFHEIPWGEILPPDVAEPLMLRLRALDQQPFLS
jgi:HAD superfamily phosphoserine phosphatase-like hydrolase